MAENIQAGNAADIRRHTQQSARLVLASFLLTFMSARILVFLVMSRRVPDLYIHASGTHIHHLNFGIVLLSMVGAVLVFRQPQGIALSVATVVYGIGLGLTFDEFGMWLHLGGPYWQRASYDAIVTIAAILALIGYAHSMVKFRPRHWAITLLVVALGIVFAVLLIDSLRFAEHIVEPRLLEMERTAPQ